MPSFNPKTQNFTILGPDGKTPITISMVVIDALRTRLANICISYGVQLGLSLMALLAVLLLTSPARMRRSLCLVHASSLVVAVMRLSLLIQYFPGPLSDYYVIWTKDRSAVDQEDFNMNTAGNALNVVQWALIETALIMQSWGLMKTWPNGWRRLTRASAIVLAIVTVLIKSLWIVHYTWALHTVTLPVTMDAVGQAATVLGAASIFYFCGIFAVDLSVHLVTTRSILKRMDRGLTNMEILAIGNGILMVLPSIFAGLDVAANLSGTRILPFDAGSWVMTLVVIGLPLISLIARYRGPASTTPSNRASHRFSIFTNSPFNQMYKARTSQGEETAFDSPSGGSFMASAEPAGKTSMRYGRMGSSRFERIESRGRSADVELGIQVRRDVSVVVAPGLPSRPPVAL
ncbi:hypothetical protein TruAng_005039 [Truncatella angustata]|nr:hypothetical protein TruAng_005039 [Truncatella angustata]